MQSRRNGGLAQQVKWVDIGASTVSRLVEIYKGVCKPGEAHNIDDLRIFPYLLCLVIFSSYIPVVSITFSLSLHSPHRHLVSSSLVRLRIIRWSCQFPGPTTSEAAVRRQPSSVQSLTWHLLNKFATLTKGLGSFVR